jgi:hypothetical protein
LAFYEKQQGPARAKSSHECLVRLLNTLALTRQFAPASGAGRLTESSGIGPIGNSEWF